MANTLTPNCYVKYVDSSGMSHYGQVTIANSTRRDSLYSKVLFKDSDLDYDYYSNKDLEEITKEDYDAN